MRAAGDRPYKFQEGDKKTANPLLKPILSVPPYGDQQTKQNLPLPREAKYHS